MSAPYFSQWTFAELVEFIDMSNRKLDTLGEIEKLATKHKSYYIRCSVRSWKITLENEIRLAVDELLVWLDFEEK